jgi:hypothetical protein
VSKIGFVRRLSRYAVPSFENQAAGGCQASVNAPGVSELFETAIAITFTFDRTAWALS